MDGSMENGQLGLALAQLVVLIVNAIIYARQKSALDVEKRDRGMFGIKVQDVERLARDANSAITSLTFEHYEALRARVEAVMVENRALRVEIDALKETIQSLSNKLASRDRADAAAIRRANQARPKPMPDDEIDDDAAEVSGDPLAQLIANGSAIPLGQQAAPEAPTLPSHFGQSARRKVS